MINFSQNPYNPKPASDKQIKRQNQLNMVLPHAHKTLLKQTNGCSVGGDVLLYGTEDIAERNATWEVHHYANGYVAIGDDEWRTSISHASDRRKKRVWIVDAGVMDPQYAELVTENLLELVSGGCIVE
ncbi:SMI1/KNR4 family protein [Bacillus sp. SL00103]